MAGVLEGTAYPGDRDFNTAALQPRGVGSSKVIDAYKRDLEALYATGRRCEPKGETGIAASLTTTYDQIYDLLLDRYGPQGWWPARGRFEVAIGAVLTQGTAWTNAAKAIAALKRTRSHRPEAIRQLPASDLADRIRPAGYHNVKAARLKALTAWWLRGGGYRGLHRLATDELRHSLLEVHGIGRETADVIVLYVFERRVFVIDAYARRLFGRIGLIDGDEGYEALRGCIEAAFSGGVAECNEYHALIVAHGKAHCRARPLCGGCCVASVCSYASG